LGRKKEKAGILEEAIPSGSSSSKPKKEGRAV
jgi:hypothetical protein